MEASACDGGSGTGGTEGSWVESEVWPHAWEIQKGEKEWPGTKKCDLFLLQQKGSHEKRVQTEEGR